MRTFWCNYENLRPLQLFYASQGADQQRQLSGSATEMDSSK
jgi:hypothetical protein